MTDAEIRQAIIRDIAHRMNPKKLNRYKNHRGGMLFYRSKLLEQLAFDGGLDLASVLGTTSSGYRAASGPFNTD